MDYRFGVVGVFTNSASQVLVCERSNRPGAWQFPQGGIDAGETPDQAMQREASEELGSDQFKILRKSADLTQYDFPEDATFPIAKKFRGQKHCWFHLEFIGSGSPNLEQSDGEFQSYKWVSVQDSLDHVIDWKKEAYKHGLKILGFWE